MRQAEAYVWRRLAAFGVDYTVIFGWIALITRAGVAVRLRLGIVITAALTDRDKMIEHALGFVTLTLPVILYFALSEQSAHGGTFAKRLLRLRVASADGGRVRLSHSIVRAALKFVPWELAHTLIWHTPGQPFVASPPAWGIAGYGLALAGAAWYAGSLFIGDGRTPYDRVAGTVVIAATGEARPGRSHSHSHSQGATSG